MNSFRELPKIERIFYNASIAEVTFGPREEFTLHTHLLIWDGLRARSEKTITNIRFGGVANLPAVKAFFAEKPYERSELYGISYVKNHTSKIGHLFIEITFERINGKIIVECQNIAISYEY